MDYFLLLYMLVIFSICSISQSTTIVPVWAILEETGNKYYKIFSLVKHHSSVALELPKQKLRSGE